MREPISQSSWNQMVKAKHFDNDPEFYKNTQRTIEGVTTDEVIEASIELFQLMDKNDVKIKQAANDISVMRDWYVWALVVAMNGYYYWTVTAEPSLDDSANTVVTIAQASETMSQTAGYSTSVGGGATVGIGGGSWGGSKAKIYADEAAYQLFWQRLMFLLGKNDQWLSCKDAKVWAIENRYNGSLDAFCSMAQDKSPPGID